MNGPNLNMLGKREPDVYGTATYAELVGSISDAASSRGIAAVCRQTNHEGVLISKIQNAPGTYDGIILNPGAYTHYAYALHDALKSVDTPAVEVHLSNIHAREEFRRVSVTAPACRGQISGLGFFGYVAAMDYLIGLLECGA
ncbi:MAG: type II 3-dehydroquinate dehydratase [Oscillospiraceae bacterium]|nr:type II 3-dehydroquinate dehydratase [Oscillospiraceae bacterium]